MSATPAAGAAPSRLAALDGLRAIAALSVLAYHAWLYTLTPVTSATRDTALDVVVHEFRLGLVLFFVLSGFLLFGPWVASVVDGRGGPRVGAYALRRAARILPAYWVVVAGSIALLWSHGDVPGVRLPPAGDLWLFVVLAQNLESDTLLRLNAPLWTLHVEATFYAALPLLGAAALALRGRGRTGLSLVALAFLALGVGWNAGVAEQDLPNTVTKVLPAMAPYFACGMLAATFAHGRALSARHARWLLAAGVALAVADAAWAAYHAQHGSTALELKIVRDLPGAAGFALVLAAVTAGPAPRLLTWRPLAWVGLVSYGVYLWHVPLVLWLRANGLLPLDAVGGFAVLLPLTLVAAAASWYLVERPAQAWARRRLSAGRARPGATPPTDSPDRSPSPSPGPSRSASASAPASPSR